MKELKRRDTQMLLGTLGDRALGIIRKERLRLSDMFKRLDENGDGVVSKLEFEDGIAGMNLNLSKVEIQKLQHALDVDGDGFIDYGELSAFLKASDKERAAKVEVRKKRYVTATPLCMHSEFEKMTALLYFTFLLDILSLIALSTNALVGVLEAQS